MNSKLIAVIAAIIIVVAAGAAVLVTNDKGDSGEEKKAIDFSVDTTARVYGNADNDYKIDSNDVKMIQDIIDGKAAWNPNTHPYADADTNGVVNADDITLVKKIINNETTKVWYKNYFGEAQEISYPLVNKNIAALYWQQGEAAEILGEWDNVKVINRSISVSRAAQFDHARFNDTNSVGTDGGSNFSAANVSTTFTIFANNNIDLILVTPNESNRSAIEASDYNAETIYLSHTANNAIASILTMGILFNKEAQAEKYMNYCVDIMEHYAEKMVDVEKKKILITMNYRTASQKINPIKVCSGIDRESTVTLLSNFANCYTSTNCNEYGQEDVQTSAILAGNYDAIFCNVSGAGWLQSPQEQFDKDFYNIAALYKTSKAYNEGTVYGTPYVYGGYSAFASVGEALHMIYGDSVATQEEADKYLEAFLNDFVGTHPSIDKAVTHYTGNGYASEYVSPA